MTRFLRSFRTITGLAVLRSVTAVVLLAAAAPTSAKAQLITFTHTGTAGSGMIGTTSFVSRGFTITAIGDVSTRTSFGNGFSIVHSSASIAIDGVGTYDFVTGTRTFVNNAVSAVGFSRASGGDLFNLPNIAAFPGWDMLGSFGPIFGTRELIQWSSSDVQTSGGVLEFDTGTTAGSFSAVVGPGTTVPEPSTYALMAAGLLAVGAAARRRRSI